MKDIKDLLRSISRQEEQLRATEFLAPCVRGGQVRAKVAGLVYTFQPDPRNFEGWGIFVPLDDKIAGVSETADLPIISEYLRLLAPLRVRLVQPLQGQTWLAYPVNESDMRQRFAVAKPVAVHLVTEAKPFEQIVARSDGKTFWFEEVDRRADPEFADELNAALQNALSRDDVTFKGITPEMRVAYDLATQQASERFRHRRQQRDAERGGQFADFRDRGDLQQQGDAERLQDALSVGGGQLADFHDRGDFWLVEWQTRDGQHHTSAIAKHDLTVISAGICLSGQDRDFDLQSLVGVVEQRD